MMYSKKVKLDRRNAIMAAVKKELKAYNAFVSPEALKKLSEVLDTSCFYRIEVIREVEEAAKRLCLYDHLVKNDHGSSGRKDQGTVVTGTVTFGLCYSHECYDNELIDESKKPDFDSNQSLIVLIETNDWRDWDGSGGNYDDDYNVIVIYAPEDIIDEAEYTKSKDAELAELCRLRETRYNLPKAE